MQELKRCPACGATSPMRETYNGSLWIECPECGMRGPTAADMWEQVENAWNALPRRHIIEPNDVDCAGCPHRRPKEW